MAHPSLTTNKATIRILALLRVISNSLLTLRTEAVVLLLHSGSRGLHNGSRDLHLRASKVGGPQVNTRRTRHSNLRMANTRLDLNILPDRAMADISL